MENTPVEETPAARSVSRPRRRWSSTTWVLATLGFIILLTTGDMVRRAIVGPPPAPPPPAGPKPLAVGSPAVDFELRFTGTARIDAETLLAQLQTLAPQMRQPVAKLREFNLHRAFLARRVLGEDVENERDPIDDVDTEHLLEVAQLRGREFVVEDHDVDVERFAELPQLLRFPLADVRRGIRHRPALHLARDDLDAGSLGELRELVERRLGLFDRGRVVGRTDQQRALLDTTEVDFGRGQAPPLAILV